MIPSPRSRILVTLFFFLVVVPAARAQTSSIDVDRWLVLGPVSVPMPAFGGDSDGPFDSEQYLAAGPQDVRDWSPAGGEAFEWQDGQRLSWRPQSGSVLIGEAQEAPAVAWLATYLEVDRWQKVRVVVETRQPVRLYLNGLSEATKTTAEAADADAGRQSEEVELIPGKHFLLLKTVKPPSAAAWEVSARIEPVEPDQEEALRITTDPQRSVRMTDITDAPVPTSVSVSPEGDLVAVTITRRTAPEGDSESRIELRSTADASLVRTYTGGMSIGSIEWASSGRRFTYIDRSDDHSDLWLVDLDAGSQERLLQDVENLGRYQWAPDGTFIVYSQAEEAPANDAGARRLEYLESRRPGFHDRSDLYRLNLPQRTTQRLTGGDLSTSLHNISPDGLRLLVSREHIRYDQRPFTLSEYSLIDLQTMQVDSLFTLAFAGGAEWSPNGRQLLITGGPSAFGEVGVTIPEGTVPNDFDTQAYVYDLASGEATPITRDFDPAVNHAFWSHEGDAVYLSSAEAAYGRMYRYDMATGSVERVATEGDVIGRVSIADHAPVGAYITSGTSRPPQAILVDLQTGASSVLADPAEDAYADVRFGEVRDWTFTNERGVEIDGHVYYPPDFDDSRKYPLIVYYYGGTTPVTRDFAGRYPKELWAANEYLVYVLQPSGAIGYGQEFSALHVNDWGERVADEIIDGVGQFLAAHTYADADRVGAIGASFGGFMTMLLQTRTDMFAAAISHAGISNIASYWGEGFWGYQYSAVATADSYPWNRPDVYVDRSPLFQADRITTPLLLLHGAADTNVPPGESLQMFTALKLLGREVEYVEVEGQDHHILDYEKRIIWTDTILAWFDRWLKDQPEWWEAMF